MDLWVVVWGGVLGHVVLAVTLLLAALSAALVGARTSTPNGRFLRSLVRARFSLGRAEPGDHVIAFGRVEVDGAPAQRFDDGGPCALASVETDRGASVARGAGIFLRTRRHRIRLAGAVSIEATTGARRAWRVGPLLARALAEARLASDGPVRVASLAIGERAIVIGRAERDAVCTGETYRSAPLALAIGAHDEPIVALGVGGMPRALARYGARSVALASVFALGFLSVASGSAVVEVVDGPGSGDARVPAHLALPLISPLHRAAALDDVDRWLAWRLERVARRPTADDLHVAELVAALRVVRPSCAREVALAEAFPGRRRTTDDGCDAEIGRAILGWAPAPDAATRAARFDDLVTSIWRAPELGPSFPPTLPMGLTREDEWIRVASLIEHVDSTEPLRPLAGLHLRRLAIGEAMCERQDVATLLARTARAYDADDALDLTTAAAIEALANEPALGAPVPLERLEPLRGSSGGAGELDRALLAASPWGFGEPSDVERSRAWLRRHHCDGSHVRAGVILQLRARIGESPRAAGTLASAD